MSKSFELRSSIIAQTWIIQAFGQFHYLGVIFSKFFCSFIRLRNSFCCQFKRVHFIEWSSVFALELIFLFCHFLCIVRFLFHFPCRARCVIVNFIDNKLYLLPLLLFETSCAYWLFVVLLEKLSVFHLCYILHYSCVK